MPLIKRIAWLILAWVLVIGITELYFILDFRSNGAGKADYGEAFAREGYIRTHLDKPCAFNANQPCTREQLAQYQVYTGTYFWQDVWANSQSFLFVAVLILLALCIWVADLDRGS